ncbi:hypothetical protein AVEN_154583-1 [Araneus ventricosus]|uniref:Uncharacterized protein n=1 Tax=Araneus ventricosus TaxID=182803 RepID=A0A4Y2FP52_ARAVE|nr:hypothetical protein AVEN_154583-1 [Araneus ventricosus]
MRLSRFEKYLLQTTGCQIQKIKNSLLPVPFFVSGVYSGTPGWVGFRTSTTKPNPTPNSTGSIRIDPSICLSLSLSISLLLFKTLFARPFLNPSSPDANHQIFWCQRHNMNKFSRQVWTETAKTHAKQTSNPLCTPPWSRRQPLSSNRVSLTLLSGQRLKNQSQVGKFGVRISLGSQSIKTDRSEGKSLSGPDNMSCLGCKICERELQAYCQKAITTEVEK